tara:strand:- start:6385 stop:6612 length:228 start_codon:yes stop_codon:yes gene_type:complete
MQNTLQNKLKTLQSKMVRYADHKKKPLPNRTDYILPDGWSDDFKWVLSLDSQDSLTKEQKKECNRLFRKYLGYVE